MYTYSRLLFRLGNKCGGCVSWNHANKRKEKKKGEKQKRLQLIMVASMSLPAPSTCTAHLALTQQSCCPTELSLGDREMAKPIL